MEIGFIPDFFVARGWALPSVTRNPNNTLGRVLADTEWNYPQLLRGAQCTTKSMNKITWVQWIIERSGTSRPLSYDRPDQPGTNIPVPAVGLVPEGHEIPTLDLIGHFIRVCDLVDAERRAGVTTRSEAENAFEVLARQCGFSKATYEYVRGQFLSHLGAWPTVICGDWFVDDGRKCGAPPTAVEHTQIRDVS